MEAFSFVPTELSVPSFLDLSILVERGNDRRGHALCRMAPDNRTAPNYRHLQLICERQAVATSNEEAQRALEDIAEQYRKMAERLEYKLQELQRN